MYLIRIQIVYLCLIALFFACSKEEDVFVPTRSASSNTGVINDITDGQRFVVFADQSKGFFIAFSSTLDSENLTFELSESPFPIKLLDNQGREWDVFGNGASESNRGQKLQRIDHLAGYWFFFPSFFSSIELHGGASVIRPSPEMLQDNEWLINTGDIHYGSFRDGIRSIDKPSYMLADGKNTIDNEFYGGLDGDELVSVLASRDGYKVYPHRILEYHEIVNDFEEGSYSTISYCPLTGTSRVWQSKIDGSLTEFGVSGLLYNNNLILYDRNSESHWSQILNIAVQGSKIGEQIVNHNIFEMKYSEVSKLDGAVLLLDPSSGNFSSYASSQYSAYATNDHIFFPLAVEDKSIPPKERVIGVTVNQLTKVYRFEDFK